ncbi:acyl-CoA dehydrogenase family protein [Prauserella cavernicola]|uniref:Acyl-CoA dehydrogenase family protein n=1 Tax=Prauserella cavernicola TaxID=2800127 RepID=A0A934V3B5_9PSEU|nr:acyl-CoA dehydrogenase family protein [Prauserella cavernicola]MBK1787091.1 acyl-CoA dehydrogenase family protein [Prauserella cavernicola]
MTQEFEFTEELTELRTMVREFCAEVSPQSVVRETMTTESGFDPALWRRLATELGVLGLAVPQSFGGEGAGLVYQAVVVEELGAALVCGPVVGTVCLAMPALTALADDTIRADYLPALVNGDRIATLAAPTAGGRFSADHVAVSATRGENGWTLSGHLAQVPDATSADLLLVAAGTETGVALFAVDGDAEGVARTSLSTLDLTRRQADVTLDGAPARLLAGEDECAAACERALLVASALLATEQVGGGQRMLDETVAHVRDRLQFGQPVGAFQAVKHRCADMLVALEQARSAAYHAVWALEDGTDDPRLAVSLAQAVASESYRWISTSAIQLHGGLGFTWEGSPHLYFKRATTDALILGSAAEHIDHVAERTVDLAPTGS